jgi:hypothetical protein
VDEAKRERIIVARYEWRAAELAYTAEAERYFGDGFPGDGEIMQPRSSGYLMIELLSE